MYIFCLTIKENANTIRVYMDILFTSSAMKDIKSLEKGVANNDLN